MREYSTNVLKDDTTLQKLLALSLLTSNGLSKDTIYALGEAGLCDGRSGDVLLEAIQKTPYWREISEETPSHLMRLQPDRPAAAFFYLALKMDDPSPALPLWIAPTMIQETKDFGNILSRIAADITSIDTDASRNLEIAAIEMIRQDPDAIKNFSGFAFHEATVFSNEFLKTALAMRATIVSDDFELASIHNSLAVRLVICKQWEEAFVSSKEAVSLFQELYEGDARKFGSYLATALANLAGIQNSLGESEQALQTSKLTVALFLKLIEDGIPITFVSFFGAMSNHGRCLSEHEGLNESIAFLEYFIRQMATLNGSKNLEIEVCRAMTLANYALLLEEAGRTEDAIQQAREAVLIVEVAASDEFGRALFPRAKLLSIYSNLLLSYGYAESASEQASEALRFWQILGDARPNLFKSDLTNALVDAARLLLEPKDLGRAVAYCFQALQLMTIEEKNVGANDLITKGKCLWVLGVKFSELDQTINAQRNLMTAISVLKAPQLVDSLEGRYHLATATDHLSALYSRVGRSRDALTCSISSVRNYRRINQSNPKRCKVDFAASINNLSNRLCSLEKFRSAKVFGEASLVLRQEIASDSETIASKAEVAVSLSNLSAVSSNLEQKEEALEYAEKAVQARRLLVARCPKKFETKLASSLTNLAYALYELGHLGKAIDISKEAIEFFREDFFREPSRYAGLISRPLELYQALCALTTEVMDVSLVGPILQELKSI